MVRFKNRYFMCEVDWDGAHPPISEKDLAYALRNSVETNFGDYGIGLLKQSLNGM